MNMHRAKMGLAFSAVALAGVALGFAVSARLDFAGTGGAEPAPPPPATASLPGSTAPATPDPAPAPTGAIPPLTAPAAPAGAPGAGFAELVKRVGPGVAFIKVDKVRGDGVGTGFLISSDGYILTNEHVISNARLVQVRLHDGRIYTAEIVGSDPQTDIALIKIEPADPLPALTLGDSDAVEVGEWVVAIGAPLGLDHTVTAGIVSAKQRRDIAPGGRRSPYDDFIQTDASINPGNSGGPLLNARGEVVGINSAVSMQGQGIGFAIPINMAKIIVPQLKTSGTVQRSYLGIGWSPVPPAIASRYGLDKPTGALVTNIVPGGPASRAGLETDEVIVAFDGKPLARADDLPWLVSTAGVGKTATLDVVGPRGKRQVKVTLDPMP